MTVFLLPLLCYMSRCRALRSHVSNDEILNKPNRSLDKRLNQFKKDVIKEIKSQYEKIRKQLQAKVTELEVSNSKLTDDVNDLREELKEVKPYSV